MKLFRKFFMEDSLEENRFHSKYNLGESGGRVRTVEELLVQSGLSKELICHQFLNTKLNDSPNWGRLDLRKIIAQMHPGATEENVLITTGTSEALFLLFRNLMPKSIALAMPAFQLLYEIPMALKSKIIHLPVRWDQFGKPFIIEEEWLSIIKLKKPSCLLINNPHNPSGLVLSDLFLDKLYEAAQNISCTLIGDEHYRFLSHPSKILGKTLYKKNTFVTGSFIKCLGVPGLRIGWCVGPKKVLSQMQNDKNYTTHTVNPLSEWISYEILKDFNSLLFKNMKQEWIGNKQELEKFLNQSKSIYGMPPVGGLVTSLGFRGVKTLKETNVQLENLSQNGVFVLPLKSMEVGSFKFQKNISNLSLINKGMGFRLGLGCEPGLFKKALIEFNRPCAVID